MSLENILPKIVVFGITLQKPKIKKAFYFHVLFYSHQRKVFSFDPRRFGLSN
jgi:hypothetical protein